MENIIYKLLAFMCCFSIKVSSIAVDCEGKVTGNMVEYKQCSHSLSKPIKQGKRQYRDKVDSKFNGSDTRCMWQGRQTITDYKGKTSHVTDIGVLLPDKLNTFIARFEDITMPPWRPLPRNVGSHSPRPT
jgi:hypothetical protein